MEIGHKPAGEHPWGDAESVYVEIGGDPAVRELTEVFYDIVAETSPVLTAMLPDDTSDTRQKLYEFLSGWMGGPPLFYERRGHPALRMRHARFTIGELEASEWTRCMEAAIARVVSKPALASFLSRQLTSAALHLRNRA
jgi:hemoglobin